MSLFANLLKGAFNEQMLKVKASMAIQRKGPEIMRQAASKLYKIEQLEIKDANAFNDSLRKGLMQRAEGDEIRELGYLDKSNHLIDQAFQGVIMASEFSQRKILHLIRTDEKLKKHHPKIQQLEQEAMQEYTELKKIYKKYGDILLQMAG